MSNYLGYPRGPLPILFRSPKFRWTNDIDFTRIYRIYPDAGSRRVVKLTHRVSFPCVFLRFNPPNFVSTFVEVDWLIDADQFSHSLRRQLVLDKFFISIIGYSDKFSLRTTSPSSRWSISGSSRSTAVQRFTKMALLLCILTRIFSSLSQAQNIVLLQRLPAGLRPNPVIHRLPCNIRISRRARLGLRRGIVEIQSRGYTVTSTNWDPSGDSSRWALQEQRFPLFFIRFCL